MLLRPPRPSLENKLMFSKEFLVYGSINFILGFEVYGEINFLLGFVVYGVIKFS